MIILDLAILDIMIFFFYHPNTSILARLYRVDRYNYVDSSAQNGLFNYLMLRCMLKICVHIYEYTGYIDV